MIGVGLKWGVGLRKEGDEGTAGWGMNQGVERERNRW